MKTLKLIIVSVLISLLLASCSSYSSCGFTSTTNKEIKSDIS